MHPSTRPATSRTPLHPPLSLPYPSLVAPRATFTLVPSSVEYRGRFFSGYGRQASVLPTPDDDFSDAFLHGKPIQAPSTTLRTIDSNSELEVLDQLNSEEDDSELLEAFDSSHLVPLVLSKWEDDIVWDQDLVPDPNRNLLSQIYQLQRNNPQMSMLPPRNLCLDLDPWFDKTLSFDALKRTQRVPPLHDPMLLLLPGNSCSELWSTNHFPVTKPRIHENDHDLQYNIVRDRFHLSRDSDYSVSRPISQARDGIQPALLHSGPAIRLAITYYKPELTAKELRHLHRPQFFFESNTDIKFSKVRSLRKRKVKGKDNIELLRTVRDMTLRDTANFILVEYSEETPLLLSNVGMSAFVYNYYRKRDDKDPNIPQASIGAINILEPEQPGPFFGFVDIDKGEAVPVLSNNMIRAPLFPQTPPKTDFILVRYTFRGQVKYFVRSVPHYFVVGQIFPALVLPPPTARVYTEYRRNRIRVGVYRLMRKQLNSSRNGINYDSLECMFPHYTEVALKARLKEFMESRGLRPGHWRLKGGAQPPSEEEIRKMVTPEQVCMFNTMEAAQRHIEDLTYVTESNPKTLSSKSIMPNREAQFEAEMLPWKLTHNFSQAIKNKMQLKIKGEGDPTGPAGAGFSLLRASKGEKFMQYLGSYGDDAGGIDEQLAYHRLIREVWERQRQSFVAPTTPEPPFEHVLMALEHYSNCADPNPAKSTGIDHAKAVAAVQSSIASTRLFGGIKTSSSNGTGVRAMPNVLVIRRRPKGMNTWQEEVVTNAVIIENYLRHKQQLDNAGDGSSLDKFRKQKLVTGSRMFRENAIQEALRKSRPVQCRRCGQTGHIKTNREKCPAWQEEERSKLKRGREDVEDFEEFEGSLQMDPAPSTAKKMKRKHPLSDLSDILDAILAQIMQKPEHKLFMARGTKMDGKDAMVLATVADKNKNLTYMSSQEFVNDIRKLHANASQAYGADHAITLAADRIKSYVISEINRRHERLREIEGEIDQLGKSGGAGGLRPGGPRHRLGRRPQQQAQPLRPPPPTHVARPGVPL